MPETVEGFFKSIQSDATAVKSQGEAFLYQCRDAATATMILEQKTLRNLCQRCGETEIVVPAGQLAKSQEQVRVLGFEFV